MKYDKENEQTSCTDTDVSYFHVSHIFSTSAMGVFFILLPTCVISCVHRVKEERKEEKGTINILNKANLQV